MSAAKKLSHKQIISESKKRDAKLNPDYDPYTGEGSLIERFPFMQSPGVTIYLPLEMKYDSLFKLIKEKGWQKAANEAFPEENQGGQDKVESLREAFHIVRCRYDFEYWCASCVKIEDNMKELVSFVLNPPQRISLRDLEEMRTGGVPVRNIEGKHRQYGSTTMKNAYAFWVQNVVHNGYSAYICSLDHGGGTKIVGRYETIVNNYPEVMGKIRLKPWMGLRNTYEVVGTNSLINIGSSERPNAPSGDTIQIALISEAGKMKSTAAKGANKLITNIMSMVQLKPHTFVMIESTAEESGAWFRSQIFKAKRGESGFKLTFISWVTDPRCQIPLPESQYKSFIDSMTTYEWEVLWENGATLDQINWYRKKSKEYDQLWEMQQENPTTIEEMFAGAGKKVFSPAMIKIARSTVRQPKYIGDIHGKSHMGPDSLKDLEFVENTKGNLQIWMLPSEYTTEKDVAHRGATFVDVGGVHKDSDYSVIKVADRWPMIEGGSAECAAVWRGHIDPELLAWKSAQIAKFFYESILAVEVNALYSRGNNTDGVHYLSIFNQIANHYPNLFTRDDPDKVRGRNLRYGYHMTNASKDILVSGLKSAWRPESGGGWVERSQTAVDEAAFFEIKEDGTMGAIEGEHDDELIATGGAKWLATDYLPAPYYIEKTKKKQIKYNEAMI